MTPISESAPHIYLSALPFAPEHSLVAQKFSSKFPNTLTVTEGRPAQWPFTLFTAEHDKGPVECLVFSPDEKTFTFTSDRNVYICDSETGHLISDPFELKHHSSPKYACFSLSGTHILIGYDNSGVVWDIERGEEQFRISGRRFVFIQCDCLHGSIASINEDENENEDGSSFQTRLTRTRVKLWDVENGTSSSLHQ